MVENVERFPAHHPPLPVTRGKTLDETQIRGHRARSVQDVAPGVAGRKRSKAILVGLADPGCRVHAGGGMHKRSWVEPWVVDAAPARAGHVIPGSDPVRPAGFAETQVDGRILNCERRPGVEHTRARELPSSQDSVRDGSGAAQILPVAADRNWIREGSGDDV